MGEQHVFKLEGRVFIGTVRKTYVSCLECDLHDNGRCIGVNQFSGVIGSPCRYSQDDGVMVYWKEVDGLYYDLKEVKEMAK